MKRAEARTVRAGGRPVGRLVRDRDNLVWLTKRVDPERHMLRSPQGTPWTGTIWLSSVA